MDSTRTVHHLALGLLTAALGFGALPATGAQPQAGKPNAAAGANWSTPPAVSYRTVKVDGLELFYSYGTNPGHYPEWQAYFRKYQPPMLIVWGKNDKIFPPAGATPYLRDLPKAELHLLDTGHFALEEDGAQIAAYIREFMPRALRAHGRQR